ncbi:hypothetical protein AAVH_22483 [Aphelenchoides avenae]|nr:hypothetical protein AAVH_22483 [Aphelenchus avenae]
MHHFGCLLLFICIATGLVPAIGGAIAAQDEVFDGPKDITQYVRPSGAGNGMMTYESAEKKCFQLKGSVAHLNSEQSAKFLSSTVFKALDVAVKVWVFKGAILDKSNVLKDTYNECYVFDNKNLEVSQEPCDKERYVLCEVPKEKTCDADFSLYFSGSCYKASLGYAHRYDTTQWCYAKF